MTSTLGLGGAERIVTLLGNAWVDQGHDVEVITLGGDSGNDQRAKLARGIAVHGLGLMNPSRKVTQALRANLLRMRRLRERLHQSRPDVVVAFGTEISALAALAGIGARWRTVVCERSDPGVYPYSRAWRAMRRLTYPFADVVVAQTRAAARKLSGGATVIPNPVAGAPEDERERPWGIGPVALAVGRLVPEKGFEILIQAFAQLARQFGDWRLVIIGDGPLRAALIEEASARGVGDRVLFAGAIPDARALMPGAELFVLSSRTEGFPNALLEAMAAGRAVVASRCECGPDEIVRDGHDGLLVAPQDPDALAEAMGRLMGDPRLREALGARARDVLERYSMERVLGDWALVLEDAPR